MDLVVVLLIVIGSSVYKLFTQGSVTVTNAEPTEVVSYMQDSSEVPIGNNLTLKKDAKAFRKILYQLGVIK